GAPAQAGLRDSRCGLAPRRAARDGVGSAPLFPRPGTRLRAPGAGAGAMGSASARRGQSRLGALGAAHARAVASHLHRWSSRHGSDGKPSFEAEWRARFERFARAYDDEPRISGWSDAGLRRRVAAFSEILPALRLPERARVLELGCGGGTYVRLLAGLGYR